MDYFVIWLDPQLGEMSHPSPTEAGALLQAAGLRRGLVTSIRIEHPKGVIFLTDTQITERLKTIS